MAKRKSLKGSNKNDRNNLGTTYENYGTQIADLLLESYNIDFSEVNGFNMFQCWLNDLPVIDVIQICVGVKDSPFD